MNLYFPITLNKEWLVASVISFNTVHAHDINGNASSNQLCQRGSGYAVLDGATGRVLIGSNSDERLPIASLTKIWTALVAIENSDLQDEVVISPNAAMAEGSSIYLQAGETVTVETLLYGLMLRSGNDAATALAEHVGVLWRALSN